MSASDAWRKTAGCGKPIAGKQRIESIAKRGCCHVLSRPTLAVRSRRVCFAVPAAAVREGQDPAEKGTAGDARKRRQTGPAQDQSGARAGLCHDIARTAVTAGLHRADRTDLPEPDHSPPGVSPP